MASHVLVNRARHNWFNSYTDIILMILSIIQGLAFTDLAQRTAELVTTARVDPLQALHLGLSFVILLRILQTYVMVALDYEAGFASFFDVVQIFLIGALQYTLYATLGHPSTSPPQPFLRDRYYQYLAALLAFGAIKYALNTKLIDPNRYPSREQFQKERILQWQNAVGSLLMGLLCLAVVRFSHLRWLSWTVPIALIVGIGLQIVNSLRATIGMRLFVRQDWSVDRFTASAPTAHAPAIVPRVDMSVRAARVEDAPVLVTMLEPQVPELAELLGLSRAQVAVRLPSLLAAGHGQEGFFGWRQWRVVVDAADLPLAGVLYFGDEEKTALSRLARSAEIAGAVATGAAERIEGCGFMRPFRDDRGVVTALFVTTSHLNAAGAVDAILDADYVTLVKAASKSGVVLRWRGNDELVVALKSLAVPGTSGRDASRVEEYLGIGALDEFIGAQLRMVRISRT